MKNDRYFSLDFVRLADELGVSINSEEDRQDLEESLIELGVITGILDLRVEDETLTIGGDNYGLEILESGTCPRTTDTLPNRSGDNRNDSAIERD